MSEELPRIPLLRQREIEAGVIGPLVRAFAEEVGEEKALEVLRRVVTDLARKGGEGLADRLGDDSLKAFAGALDLWRENDALQTEMLEESDERLSFNVVRCRYAELYRAMGLGDLGASLSCQRDFALIEGFNPEIELERTQTLMEGAPYCDFRFRRKSREREVDD